MIRSIFVPLILIIVLTVVYCVIPAARVAHAGGKGGFVVAELFTSQGCSSCPPADLELARLKEKAARDGLAIYPISYHVQYWDYLGWKEPYGLAEGTSRQRAYASRIGSSVFTPQLILNGSISLVGSKGAEINSTVRNLLAQSSSASIKILQVNTDEKSISVRFQYEGSYDKPFVQLVVLKGVVSNPVPRGENSGRELKHINVARALKGQVYDSRKGQGQLTLQVPEKSDEVVLLLQEGAVGQVVAVTSKTL